ncbi:MAG TPA: hypothetical protein VH413_09540 [Verrucomicrobiae bacterium]|jgi:hypothetical protein|nr:hypothetical protein [Verrucomicrobiae bacterium]
MKPTIKGLCGFALLGLLLAGCTTGHGGSCCDGGSCDAKTAMKPAATNTVSTVPSSK